MTKRVAILGGGVTGLAAAFRLRKAVASADELAVTVLEARPRFGGSIGTERKNGFIIEAGADSFLTAKPRGVDLAREVGLGDRFQGQRERRFFIVKGGAFEPLPEGLVLLASPQLRAMYRSRLLTSGGKARAMMDLVLPCRRTSGDESLASFVRRRLGREVLERIAGPLVAGIHAGDPERLSMVSLLPQFLRYEREHGSVIRGLRASTGPRPSPDPAVPQPFATFRDGMAELVDGLVRLTAGVEWRLATKALAIEQGRDDGFEIPLGDGTSLRADAVVLATSAPVSAQLLAKLEPNLAAALRAIPYAFSAAVSLAFPADACRALDGSGFLVPRTEGIHMVACTWASSKFEGRAPPGHVLLRAFYGGAREAPVLDRSDEDLADLAVQELTPLLGLRGPPELARVHRWPQAHPQYEVGHADRVAVIESALGGAPGLFLAGSAYRGIGIPDCIEDADRAAWGLLSFLSVDKVPPREAIA